MTNTWANRPNTGSHFPFTVDYVNLFKAIKKKNILIWSRIETQSNHSWHTTTINWVCKLSKKNGKLLTGKKMLGSRAKIPVSFMQLPDALINGHLWREEEKKKNTMTFCKKVTSSNYSQILLFSLENTLLKLRRLLQQSGINWDLMCLFQKKGGSKEVFSP